MLAIKEFKGPVKSWSVKISASIIFLSIIISILGYLICVDKTPNANDGLVEIGKQLPGYSVKVLRIRKNYNQEGENFFKEILNGQMSDYSVIPIKDVKIEGIKLTAEVVGKEDYFKEYNLLDVVFPVLKGPIQKGDEDFYIEKDGLYTFKTIDGEEVEMIHAEVIDILEKENIVERSFILGTDRFGRDLYSRLVLGTRISVFIGFAAVIISLFVGLLLGTLSGYYGGLIDNIVMWLMSVVWSVPGIMLVIAVSMVLGSKGIWVTFIAVGLTTWVEAARVIRGQVMTLKEMQFIEAARAYGLRNFSIIFKHIIPNIYSSLIVVATAIYAVSILLEAGLSFLGLSVQPPTPSWGNMVYEGYQVLGTKNSWHLILFPGLAIIIMVLSFNLLGIGLQKATNPQKQTSNI